MDLVIVIGKLGLARDGSNKVSLAGGSSANELLKGILPSNRLLQEVVLVKLEEAEINQDRHKLGVTSKAKGSANTGLGLRNVVTDTISSPIAPTQLHGYIPIDVASAVTVTVGDEVVANVASVVRLGRVHEILAARNVDALSVLDVLGVVLEGQQHTTAAPAELVA